MTTHERNVQGVVSVVGVSGLVCSGKSTFARILAGYTDAMVVSFGSFFRKWAKEGGMLESRETLDAISSKFVSEKGLGTVIDAVLSPGEESALVILDGIRMIETITYIENAERWRYLGGVFVTSAWGIRASRLEQRRGGDLTREDLTAYDERLMSLGLLAVAERARWKVANEGSLARLSALARRVAVDLQGA